MNLRSTTEKQCVLVGAGEAPSCRIELSEGDYLIAVDGGYDYCGRWNLTPDLVLGDLDSISPARKAAIGQFLERTPERVRLLPAQKDDTDMLAALRVGLDLGYRSFRIYGGTGGRLDHTLANIQCLVFLKDRGAQGYLISDRETLFLIRNESVCFHAKSFGIFSLFALQKQVTGVTIKGTKYTLDGACLTDAFPIGVSNEFIGEEAMVSVKDGTLLAVMPSAYDGTIERLPNQI